MRLKKTYLVASKTLKKITNNIFYLIAVNNLSIQKIKKAVPHSLFDSKDIMLWNK